MARKVTDITQIADNSYLLSQTPKDYNKSNFYIKELQDKVNAEWRFRPNRVDVEYENTWGEGDYAPIEVVVQRVKNDNGTAYSDDYRRLVFRDIREKRFNIGSKFRFDAEYNLQAPELSKNYWLTTNFSSIEATTSVVIQRCTGILKSSFVDAKGVTHYHEEPAIQGTELRTVGFSYNEVAVSPESELIALVQHNQYTKNYYINQRFIIGYDKVYRIKAINKFYASRTNDPYSVGLMRVYLALTESSPYDDFENRIAYQSKADEVIIDGDTQEGYYIKIESPEVLPSVLRKQPVNITCGIYNKDIKESSPIQYELSLPQLEEHGLTLDQYVEYTINGDTITLSRKKGYSGGRLSIKAYSVVDSKEISITFELGMWN